MSMALEVVSARDDGVRIVNDAVIDHEPGKSAVFFRNRCVEFDNLNLAIQYLMGFGYVRIAPKKKSA